MIVDTHTHLLDSGHWAAEWWTWVAQDWASKAPDRRPEDILDRIEDGLIDPDGTRMVSSMDAAGVDMSVILPIDWGPDFTGTKPIDEIVSHAIGLAERHQGRLLAFGGIDPRRPDAIDLVTRWFAAGARGLKLYPSCGWHPTDDEAAEVYAMANAQRRPVLFHTGDPLPLLDRANSNPALLDEVAAAYPNMPIWLGHAGAPHWWEEALVLARKHANVRLEMSVWIWEGSSPDEVDRCVSHIAEAWGTIGPSRLLFGTDNVSGSKVRKAGFLREIVDFYHKLPVRLAAKGVTATADQMDAVMGHNALRDLGLAWGSGDE